MQVLQSLLIAVSMYSAIPVFGIRWEEKNMKYCMNAFPLVGFFIGLFMFLFHLTEEALQFPKLFCSVIYTILPIAITGGIHLDGYMDTVDARASHKSPAEKRRILKDPNVGAFSVIHLVCLLLFTASLWYCLPEEGYDPLLITLGFVFSRCLSGLSVLTFPKAEGSGLVSMFSQAANKEEHGKTGEAAAHFNPDRIVLGIQRAECFAVGGILCLRGCIGVMIIITSVIIYCYYRRMSQKEFEGLNGDQAGWFLTITEVWITTVIVAANSLIPKIIQYIKP